MKQDHDFVLMPDYQADMAEVTNQAAGVITHLQGQIRERDRMLALLILAAGGEISIPHSLMGRAQPGAPLEVETSYNLEKDGLILRAKFG